MECRVFVSVSRRVLRPIFAKATGLETLNIAKKWFSKISIIQQFLLVIFAGKKQAKHVGKMPGI